MRNKRVAWIFLAIERNLLKKEEKEFLDEKENQFKEKGKIAGLAELEDLFHIILWRPYPKSLYSNN